MFLESLPENIAVVVVAIQCPDLGDIAKPFKCLVVELVDVRKVRVGQNDVREFLHVSKAMRDSERISLRMSLAIGKRQTRLTDLVGSSVLT